MRARVLGHDIFYTSSRRGAPPWRAPMLTLHGGPGFDHTYLARGLDVLSDEMEVIYYDQLGSGRSERPASLDGGMEVWVDEVDALREHLGHDKVVLFGHSFGSFIAIDVALRYGARLAGLILCSSAPAMDYPAESMRLARARATPEQFEALGRALGGSLVDDEAFRAGWQDVMPAYVKTFTPALGKAMSEGIQYSALAYNHGIGKCLPAFNRTDELGEIAAPTLILQGRHDWITPPAQGGERLAAGIRGSELVTFEESGHYPFLEEPERFEAVVRAWLRRLE